MNEGFGLTVSVRLKISLFEVFILIYVKFLTKRNFDFKLKINYDIFSRDKTFSENTCLKNNNAGIAGDYFPIRRVCLIPFSGVEK